MTKLKQYKNSYSFYVLDDDGEKWYWNGRKFTYNEEECILYFTDLDKDYILKNYHESPIFKKLYRIYSEIDNIKIRVY